MPSSFRLSDAAAEAPAACAWKWNGRSTTYSEAWALVEKRLARHHGWRRPAALVVTPELEPLLEIYACLELGRPVVLLHHRWPRDQQVETAEAVGAEFLWCAGTETRLSPQEVGLADDDLIVLATSGTTSTPKLVPLSAANLQAAAQASEDNLGWFLDDAWGLTIPVSHVGGLSILTRCLLARRPWVKQRYAPGEAAFASESDTAGVTLASWVPTQLARVLEQQQIPEKLRAVLVGGAPLALQTKELARKRGLPVLATYGMTESAAQFATESIESLDGPAQQGVGAPLLGNEIRIENGALLIRGPSVARGYLGRAPTSQDAWFRTQDLAQLDAANRLVILGRDDALIISGGENVSPEAVEAVLQPLIDGPLAVVGTPHPTWGEQVTLVTEGSPSQEQREAVLNQVKVLLPAYAVPKRWLTRSSLPLLPNGKLDRRTLTTLVSQDT